MADYIYIDNYAKKGKIAISQSVFDSLAASALSNVKGISLSSKKEHVLLYTRGDDKGILVQKSKKSFSARLHLMHQTHRKPLEARLRRLTNVIETELNAPGIIVTAF